MSSLNINNYRGVNDTDKEWQLKKLFIETHQGKFDEKRLICLAQCYANIERLGCRYSNEIMKQIKDLTSDFEPIIKELTEQDDKMRKLDRQFNDIKFIQSTCKDDKHFQQQKQQQQQNVNYNNNYNENNRQQKNGGNHVPVTNFPVNTAPRLKVSLTTPLSISKPYQQDVISVQQPTQIRPPQVISPTSLNFNKLSVNEQQNLTNSAEKKVRNALLNSLINSPQQQQQQREINEPTFENFRKVMSLREKIQFFIKNYRYSFNKNDESFVDVVDLMHDFCRQLTITIEYRVKEAHDCSYMGSLYIENYKLTNDSNKKKKKCKYGCYINAFDLLKSDSMLAAKSVQIAGQPLEYELHRIDENISAISSDWKSANSAIQSPSNLDEFHETKATKQEIIKEALQDFIIFIPSNLIYDENCVTDRNSIAILTRSCAKNQCNLVLELILKGSNETDTIINEANNFEDDENCDNKKYKCKCIINKIKIASVHAKNKQEAKRLCALKAVIELQKMFPTIREESKNAKKVELKENEIDDEQSNDEKNPLKIIKMSKKDVINGTYPELEENPLLIKFSQSKLGTNLLKKWGWKGEGHGIGKEHQGISEPINFQVYQYRQGLGCKEMVPKDYDNDDYSDKLDESLNVDFTSLKQQKFTILKNLNKFLNNYLHSKCESDLEFESSFSNEERRLIHQEAHKIGLKTQSLGTGNSRYLTISKKRSPIDILEVINKNNGQYGKYKLIDKQ